MTSGGLLAAVPPERADDARLARSVGSSTGRAGDDRSPLGRPYAALPTPQRCMRASGSPSAKPASDADDVGEPARLGDGERHQRHHDGDHRRPEQVAVDLLAGAQREQVGDRPREQQRERAAVAAEPRSGSG